MKNLLRTSDLSKEDFELILTLANQFKKNPYQHHTLFQHETILLYFNKPSTRTRLSLQTAVTRLGGLPAIINPQELQLGRGETIEDTAKVISRYARAFVIRTFNDEEVKRFADNASIPVINALTDMHHPLQSLADLMILQEKLGSLHSLKIAYLGDGNNVAHSLLEAAAIMGINISLATPPHHEPNLDIVTHAKKIAQHSGAEIILTHDPLVAVKNANVLYTDVWTSMHIPQEKHTTRLKIFMPYQVNATLMSHASPLAIFMHCLPAHRNEEVSQDIFESKQSVVFDQAENRLYTAQAVLYALSQQLLKGF